MAAHVHQKYSIVKIIVKIRDRFSDVIFSSLWG